MSGKKAAAIILCLLAPVGIAACLLLIAPAVHEQTCRTRVFADMQQRVDEVTASVIGILPRTEAADGSVTYGHGGSGVIFERDGEVYYALTAAHAVNDPDAAYKVYTAKTEVSTIDDPAFDGIDIEIVDTGFYDSLADVTVEYVSPGADLAVVSFHCEDELTVAQLAREEPQKGDRLVCLGHPDGKGLTVSYGTITSGLKSVTMTDKATGRRDTDSVLAHDAYLNPGSSGGPAFSGDMSVAGINIGGAFDLFDHFKAGFMIPAEQLKDCIAEWKAAAEPAA